MISAQSLAIVRRPPVIVAALGVTQIIGWGSIFSPLTVLGTPIGHDIQAPREVVFAGITVMLLVSALFAPRIGKRVDASGARRIMVLGS
ncbi:MAG TPA: MFS transporter, partial [Hyphomicrobiaceae bacterium]|nr:MFS transporter [Hyphomicrobiaceae bacterium]